MNSICFLVGELTFKSGIVRVVYNIANELRKSFDLQISFMCTYVDADIKDEFESRFDVYDLNLKKCPKRLRYFRMVKGIHKYIRNNELDVIIVSGMELILSCWIACLNIDRIKKVAWEHRNFFAGPRFRLEWIGKRLACRKFDGIISITKKDYQFYQNYKGDRKNLYQIYNLFEDKNVCEDCKLYDLESHKIISCGSLSSIKGFDMLIQIAAKVMPLHEGWTWDIYGEGDERAHLEKLIKSYNLENYVFLRGYHPNMCEVYRKYSFFVFTSRMEGMGMVLIEAQKANLPIVSFDILCGPSEVIVHNRNGYLIQPFIQEEMERRISFLMESEVVRVAFSSNARMMHQEFEKEYVVKKWEDLIRKIDV